MLTDYVYMEQMKNAIVNGQFLVISFLLQQIYILSIYTSFI